MAETKVNDSNLLDANRSISTCRRLYYMGLDNRLKRNLRTGIALVFVAGLLAVFAHPDYRQGEPSLHGRLAKDFAFTLDGKAAHLSDYRGKVVVLNFWATWCPPCVDETPSLVALQQQIAPLGGTVLGISVDDDATAYTNFLKAYNISFPTSMDPSRKTALDYGTTMFPDTYVIDRSGHIDRKIVGGQDWTAPEMTQYFDSLLKAK